MNVENQGPEDEELLDLDESSSESIDSFIQESSSESIDSFIPESSSESIDSDFSDEG